MFEQCPETRFLNIDEVELFAWTCYHDTKSDWRLPKPKELGKLIRDTGYIAWHSVDVDHYIKKSNYFTDMRCITYLIRDIDD